MNQYTLSKKYNFEGKGLHTGRFSHMSVCPAPENTGVRFHRIDLGPDAFVDALALNVSSTARSTTISCGEVSVSTIEHIMSALTGLGIDNALIEIDNIEVPILDGSARIYLEAMSSDPKVEQSAPRRYFEISEPVEIKDEKTGSYIRVTPDSDLNYDITVDFNSKVLGIQTAHWDLSSDYENEIGKCRTFCFFHEVEYLAAQGLVKGGDVENAIVVVEHPVSEQQLDNMSKVFGQPRLSVKDGYLSNLVLRFPNECGRHKMLDMIGDLRLVGGYLKARVEAYKPGHTINTNLAKELMKNIR